MVSLDELIGQVTYSNESRTHLLLKSIGILYLRHMGVQFYGTEVQLTHPKRFKTTGFKRNYPHKRFDVAGLQVIKNGFRTDGCVHGMEVVISPTKVETEHLYTDCLWIVSIKGAIPLEEIPSKFGVLEVDFDRVPQIGKLDLLSLVQKRRDPQFEYHCGFLIDERGERKVDHQLRLDYLEYVQYSIWKSCYRHWKNLDLVARTAGSCESDELEDLFLINSQNSKIQHVEKHPALLLVR